MKLLWGLNMLSVLKRIIARKRKLAKPQALAVLGPSEPFSCWLVSCYPTKMTSTYVSFSGKWEKKKWQNMQKLYIGSFEVSNFRKHTNHPKKQSLSNLPVKTLLKLREGGTLWRPGIDQIQNTGNTLLVLLIRHWHCLPALFFISWFVSQYSCECTLKLLKATVVKTVALTVAWNQIFTQLLQYTQISSLWASNLKFFWYVLRFGTSCTATF